MKDLTVINRYDKLNLNLAEIVGILKFYEFYFKKKF